MGECRSYPKIASKMNILQRKVLRAGERCFCALHLLCASLFQAPLYLGLKSYLQITVSMILEVPTNIEYSFCQFAWWHNNSMLTLQCSKPACKTASLYYKEQSQEFLWLDLFRTTLFPWINHNSVCVCVCVYVQNEMIWITGGVVCSNSGTRDRAPPRVQNSIMCNQMAL